MSATYRLFSKWKAAKNLTSDNQGATALGMGRASVSQWKSGRNAEAHVIAKMASEIGEESGAWLAAVQAEKAPTALDRKEWLRLASRLGYAASITLVIGLIFAAQVVDFSARNLTTLYIMSTCAIASVALGTFFALGLGVCRKEANHEFSLDF